MPNTNRLVDGFQDLTNKGQELHVVMDFTIWSKMYRTQKIEKILKFFASKGFWVNFSDAWSRVDGLSFVFEIYEGPASG